MVDARTLIIVPTYNEKENISTFVPQVLAAAADLELLVIDDNSPDGTGDIVAAMAETDPRIHLVQRAGKLGLGSAYVAGFDWALAHDYDFVFEMDADFSHNPKYIAQLRAALESGADMAVGSRNIRGGGVENWPWYRKLISRGGSIYSNIILGLGVNDATAGFVAYRRQVLETIGIHSIRSNGYVFQIEAKYRAKTRGYKIVEVPIIFPDRVHGVSKMAGSIVREAVIGVLVLRYKKMTNKLLDAPDKD